jgi:hypothetical protein
MADQLTHFRFETIALEASRFGELTTYSAATVSKKARTANLDSGSQSAPLSDTYLHAYFLDTGLRMPTARRIFVTA